MKSILRNSLKLILALAISINLVALDVWAAPRTRAKKLNFETLASLSSYSLTKKGVTYINNLTDAAQFEAEVGQSLPQMAEALANGKAVIAISSGVLSYSGAALDLLKLTKISKKVFASLVLSTPGYNCLSAAVLNNQVVVFALSRDSLGRVVPRFMFQKVACD